MKAKAAKTILLLAEPEYVLKLYGLDRGPKTWPKEINDEEETFYFAQKCLAARRLLERGVRFVQVWSGNDNGFPRRNWDSHEDVRRDHGPLATGMARGSLRRPRHPATPTRDRSRKTELLSQWYQTPSDRCARTCHRAATRLTFAQRYRKWNKHFTRSVFSLDFLRSEHQNFWRETLKT